MTIKQYGANGGMVRAAITGIPGFEHKTIQGIEDISGGSITVELGMVRGAGGGFFKDYSGEGFLSVEDITLKLWWTTYCDLITAMGGYDQINKKECTISVWTEYPNGSEPTLKHNYTKCRMISAPVTMSTSQVENILVDVTFKVLEVKLIVG